MRFKVGDKVRIRKDLVAGIHGVVFIRHFNHYKGKETTITEQIGDNHYRLEIDKGAWCWTDEMLEPAEKIYLTWELLKMAEEGEKGVFKNLTTNKITYLSKTNSKQGALFEDEKGKGIVLSDFIRNDEWIRYKPPVTWQEAIQAIIDGKNVKVECPNCDGFKKYCVYQTNDFKDSHICGEGILDGTWFIEETGCKI